MVIWETANPHTKTKGERDFAQAGWEESSAECDQLYVKASEAGRLSKLVARLQKQLNGKIEMDAQKASQGEVLEADRKLRAALRQQEDAEAKCSHILEQYKREAAEAARRQQELAKECAEVEESRRAAAKMLAKAVSLRSCAGIVAAETRATNAEADVARLQKSVASLKFARDTD
eukprot:3332010-Pleurochrysis_carterae.AAC.1